LKLSLAEVLLLIIYIAPSPCSGYISWKSGLVEAATAWLSAPSPGVDSGSTPVHIKRLLFQGPFLSTQMVGEALKGGVLIAEVMATRGYDVQPQPLRLRHDVVQVCIIFHSISTNIMK
jgi:cystathionine beta-lyase family protein involved in aluminum resistance